jgi:AmmeMemoRadiSam system protein A
MIGEYTQEQGKILLKLARASIEEAFSKVKPKLPKEKEFKQARGVFVTLTKKGDLRGCIGFPLPNLPIAEAVYNAAKSSAFQDPRFPSLEEAELKDIKIEISVLTIPQDTEIKDIKVGEDGLICNYLGYQGLLLPQVAVENNFSKVKFLECLCNKAGLPKDTWSKPHFKLQRFQAQIFQEEQGF